MHYSVAAEAVHEIQTFDIWRRPNDAMMIGSHFVQPGPGATWVHSCFSQNRDARRGVSQNLLDKTFIEISFEAGRFLWIVPRQENPLPFTAKMKAGGHIDHHKKSVRQ